MKKIIFIFSIVLIVGCVKVKEKPENLISEKQMTEILVDYYIYKHTNLVLKKEEFDPKEFPKLNLAILKKHNTDYHHFNESLDYYILQDSDGYKKILENTRGAISDMNPILIEDSITDKNNSNQKKLKENLIQDLPPKKSKGNIKSTRPNQLRLKDSIRINLKDKPKTERQVKDLKIDSAKTPTQKINTNLELN